MPELRELLAGAGFDGVRTYLQSGNVVLASDRSPEEVARDTERLIGEGFGIDIAVDKQTHVTVTGIDRQLVGQVAADIRAMRKPDPYKQKGVRYTGEVLKKKAGKTGAK